VLLHYRIPGLYKTRRFLNGKYRILFSKLTFHVNKTLKHGVILWSYHMLMRQNFDPLWSKLSYATSSRRCLGEVRLYKERKCWFTCYLWKVSFRSEWHFSKARCENCAKYNKETFVDMHKQIKTTIKFSQHFGCLLYSFNRMVSTTNRVCHWLWEEESYKTSKSSFYIWNSNITNASNTLIPIYFVSVRRKSDFAWILNRKKKKKKNFVLLFFFFFFAGVFFN